MGDDFSKPESPEYYSAVGLKERSDSDTIIIWDWDDTLMCTNAIISGRTMGGGPIPELEDLVEKCLTISMSLGETIIVTNADEAWVWESAHRYAPRCVSLLSQVSILSAKGVYQNRFPDDGFAWKRETFFDIFRSRRLTYGLNLIVLGDSDCEIQAAWTCTRQMSADSLCVKTVKFKEAPTCEELCDQQKMMVNELATIVDEEESSNRNLAWRLRSSVGSSSFGHVGSFGGAPPSTAMIPQSCSMPVSMAHSLGQPLMLGGSSQYGGLGSSYLHNSRPMYVM